MDLALGGVADAARQLLASATVFARAHPLLSAALAVYALEFVSVTPGFYHARCAAVYRGLFAYFCSGPPGAARRSA